MREVRTARREERWVRVEYTGKGEKIYILVNNSQQGYTASPMILTYLLEIKSGIKYQVSSKLRRTRKEQ